MWKNYLLTSYRALKKEKYYAAINLLSLSLAFALCTIGFFNYQYNHTYNHQYKNYRQIYKINAIQNSATASKDVGITPLALTKALRVQNPTLKIARYQPSLLMLKIGNKMFSESISYVDDAFLDLFSFQSAREKLSNDEIIITSKTAVKIFNTKLCVGELVEILLPNGNYKSFKVKQVVNEPNNNTSFPISIFMSFDNYLLTNNIDDKDWSSWIKGTFISVENQDTENVEALLNSFLAIQNIANTELELASYRLDRIDRWAHIEQTLYGRGFRTVLHPASVIGTISSALAILLLAVFNFFNTSIAASGRRLKEISMRKVVGGQRRDIIIQFMLENGLQVISAYLLSLAFAYAIIGHYNAMFSFELVEFQPEYLQSYILYSSVICLFTILLSGAYPAFYISKFKSLDILRDSVKLKGNNKLTKTLLALQFAICVYNIFSLGVFVENSYYQDNLDRGYDVKSFINIPLSDSKQYHNLNNEIAKETGFELVVGTKNLIGKSGDNTNISYDGLSINVDKYNIGELYLSTLGVKFSDGNDFMKDRVTNKEQVLVNKVLADQLGDNMLNQTLTINKKPYRIAGITENFNLKSIMLSNKIAPTVFLFTPDAFYEKLVVKCNQNTIVSDNERLKELWYTLYPNEIYKGFYQERVLKSVDSTNKIMIRINSFIAISSILISILGMYALISLTIQRRIKEIGIRKVMGASFSQILQLLVKEITWIMLASIVIGLSAGTYIINMLLDIIYAYHLTIDVYNYIFSLLVILIVLVISITYKVVVTARMNPASQLRVE